MRNILPWSLVLRLAASTKRPPPPHIPESGHSRALAHGDFTLARHLVAKSLSI